MRYNPSLASPCRRQDLEVTFKMGVMTLEARGLNGCLLVVALGTLLPIAGGGSDASTRTRLEEAYGKLPLSFEANAGQTDPRVIFLSRSPGFMVFLTPIEAVLVSSTVRHESLLTFGGRSDPGPDPVPTAHVLRMRLVGANPAPRVTGLQELLGRSNYFIGNEPHNWRIGVPTYASVQYEDVYPGIDLVYHGQQGRLEYDFVVAPGADPEGIQLAFIGADEVEIDDNGDLVLHVSGEQIRMAQPLVYQERSGGRQRVSSGYVMTNGQQIGIRIGEHGTAKAPSIAPVVNYSTYLGGGGKDVGSGIAVDSSGNIYVTGLTDSSNFPNVNAIQRRIGHRDAFVTKITAAGDAIVYSTYLGGSESVFTMGNGFEFGSDIAVDAFENVYVTGNTDSTDFPTVNAFQPTYGGGGCAFTVPCGDAFVTKLDATGSRLVYSTYLGGSANEAASGIVVDRAGNAFVVGTTSSPDFPTVSPLQFSHRNRGDSRGILVGDVFVTKLNAAGDTLVYSTHFGGSSAEDGRAIAIDAAGRAVVTGFTASPDFPTASPLQAVRGGDLDVFVTMLDVAGSAFVYSTYLGGRDSDRSVGITVDSAGNAYVTGTTASTDFPTQRAFQATLAGGLDAFVASIRADGSALNYSTYLGGSDRDVGTGVVVNRAGQACIVGFTKSSDFPILRAIQVAFGGDVDAFMTKLDSGGSALMYSTYFGGQGIDIAWDITMNKRGTVYLTGETGSLQFPLENPIQNTFGGGSSDAFVARVCEPNQ